ncbi:MAG: response regulator [Syntrophothermus sp.]
MPEKILVVEDERPIAELIRFNLEKEGFAVVEAYDGFEALEIRRRENPALVILDIMLPSLDGWEVCKIIRRESKVPIIMLTARGEEIDKVLGLELGADDYVTKPFSPRELIARVKAVLRRARDEHALDETAAGQGAAPGPGANGLPGWPRHDSGGQLVIGSLLLDWERREVFMDGARVELTLKEFELLSTLARNRGRVLTRDLLLESIWGYEYTGDTRTVDVHIRRLRQKLGDDREDAGYIETVRGVGYRMRER